MTTPIQIWEQHAGQAPRLHATTTDLDAVAGIAHAWWVRLVVSDRYHVHRSTDDILVVEVVITPQGWRDRPIATLWIEYPDDVIAVSLPGWLHPRWCGGVGGEAWDRVRARRVGR